MSLISDISKTLLPGKIISVQVGYYRTAVMAETDRGITCGLAATLQTLSLNTAATHR